MDWFPLAALGSLRGEAEAIHATAAAYEIMGVGKAFASPPSEPYGRFSRIRLSSRWFPHRDCLACRQAVSRMNSPAEAKKALGQRIRSSGAVPQPGRFSCLRTIARSRRRTKASTSLRPEV